MIGAAAFFQPPMPPVVPYLTSLFRAMLQAPELADPDLVAAPPVEVARVPQVPVPQRVGRRRAWRAIPITEATRPAVQAVTRVVAAEADAGFARLEWLSRSVVVGESTMVGALAGPVLQRLGWVLDQNHRFPDGTRPDGFAFPAVFEFKRPDVLYDGIDARNAHSAYKTVAEQILTYLRQEGIACVIYTNGRFWWRVEEDEETGELFAMRFNLHLAVNDWRNRVTHARKVNRLDALYSPMIERFVQTFCADAFAPGCDTTVSAHVGMNMLLRDVGVVWLKDLNQGFG